MENQRRIIRENKKGILKKEIGKVEAMTGRAKEGVEMKGTKNNIENG